MNIGSNVQDLVWDAEIYSNKILVCQVVSIVLSLTGIARLAWEKKSRNFQNGGKQQVMYRKNNKLEICNTRNRNVFRNLPNIQC